MKKIFSFIMIILIVVSCNNVDKKDITVIENIQLGTNYTNFQRQLDSLGIKSKTFFSKTFFYEISEINNNKITFHTSEIFNLEPYKKETNIYSLIYPIKMTGTDNIIGLSVIIGHTYDTKLFTNGELYNLAKEYKTQSFNQNIPEDLVKEIKLLLVSKYGSPILDDYKSENNSFFVLEGSEFKSYVGDAKIQCKLTTWETENLNIELYSGIPSSSATFTKDGFTYVIQPLGKENDVALVDFSKGEKQCKSYVYINYQLKSETIKRLKLNEKKL